MRCTSTKRPLSTALASARPAAGWTIGSSSPFSTRTGWVMRAIEGLRWPVLFGVYTEQQAMDVLDAQLDLIF